MSKHSQPREIITEIAEDAKLLLAKVEGYNRATVKDECETCQNRKDNMKLLARSLEITARAIRDCIPGGKSNA